MESNETTLSVTPSTSAQTLTPSSPYTGFDEVDVEAVDSSIDINIQSGNIKSGISILGVSGTLTELNADQLSVTPSTSAQTITPTSPYNAFDEVSVSAVTSSIDANISAGNIKSGVTILGVAGSVTELKGQTKSRALTSTSSTVITPDAGYNGLTSVTVAPTNYTGYSPVNPSTSPQNLTIPSGFSGLGPITINPVTYSIDSDIIPSNIRSGVNILGINGNLTPLNGTTIGITPSTTGQTYYPSSPYNGYTSVSVAAVGAYVDPNITAGNIKDGVSILGVTGNYTGTTPTGTINITTNGTHDVTNYATANVSVSGGPAYYIEKTKDANNKLVNSSNVIDLTGITDIGDYALYDSYSYTTSITNPVNMSSILNVTGNNACRSMFYGSTGITSINLGSLDKVTGTYGCGNMCYGCTNLTSATIVSLSEVNGDHACYRMFYGCTGLTSINLNHLQTIAGNYACSGMFQDCTSLHTASLSFLEDINGTYACYQMFVGCSSLSYVYVDDIESIQGEYSCAQMFRNCIYLAEIEFPSLYEISGGNACRQMFNGCSSLYTVSFPSLEQIIGTQVFYQAFQNCSVLAYIFFDSLTTTSFSTANQFNTMLSGCSNVTLYFPSNLQTTISGLTGYPNFGGSNTTCSFTLPATS